MPYDRNSDLPDGVKNALPARAQTIWRIAFNRADNGNTSEESCFKIAWGSVKRAGWEKGSDGSWTRLAKERTFRPPEAVQNNVLRGLDMSEEIQPDEESMAFAKEMKTGDGIPLSRVAQIHDYLADRLAGFREISKSQEPSKSKETVEWLCSGGTPGLFWTGRVLEKFGDLLDSVDPVDNADSDELEINCDFVKVDDSLGLVLGWALICTEDGKPYHDQSEYRDGVADDEMLRTATKFMQNSRLTDEMHDWGKDGLAVFSWPMTAEIAAAYKITTPKTGWMIGIRPSAEVLQKFKDGTYTGFSIGGHGVRVPVAEEAADER